MCVCVCVCVCVCLCARARACVRACMCAFVPGKFGGARVGVVVRWDEQNRRDGAGEKREGGGWGVISGWEGKSPTLTGVSVLAGPSLLH